jgi:regulator of sirC expression with transglutaminase-like and TPR domain
MLRSYLHDYEGGLHDLETYLQYSQDADDADIVRHNVESLRRLVGRQAR